MIFATRKSNRKASCKPFFIVVAQFSQMHSKFQEPFKGMDTFSNYNYVFLKNHKGITTLIWTIIVFGNRFHCLQNFNVQNLMQIENILKVITFKILGLIVVFFKQHFSLQNVHHSFSRLKRTLIMMIKRTKGIEIDELHFYNAIQHLRFKHVFNHRNHKF